MTESLRPYRVTCHFCGLVVLDIAADKAIVKRVVNTQPKIVKETEVHRCDDCKAKGCGEKGHEAIKTS